jgi:acyl-CoA dehydrogenase
MNPYRAPLAEMQFVMTELAGLEGIATLPGFEEATPDTVAFVLDEAARFATEVLDPLNRVGDREGARLSADGSVTTPPGFRDAYRQFCELGWNGLAKNPHFGGGGMPQLVAAAVDEMWNATNMAFELCPMLTAGAVEAIERNGSDQLKRAYLPKMVSGEWTGTMNLTEPQAGSDLAAVRTKAVRQADGSYKLYGNKIFITYGEHDYTDNIVHLVLARTPDAPAGTKGISLFVVPKFLIDADGSTGPASSASIARCC